MRVPVNLVMRSPHAEVYSAILGNARNNNYNNLRNSITSVFHKWYWLINLKN